jgi:peptidoglycan/xylan/chitin deacetylase (PgdA/CDA1 family)
MAAEGHEVESHGYRHRPLGGLPVGEVREDLSRAAAVIERLTGRRPAYFRPPHAVLDAAVLREVQRAGQRVVLWTNIGAEQDEQLPPPEMVRRLLAASHPGAILMLYGDRPGSATLVEALLDQYQRRGFVAMPLGAMLRLASARR